MANIKHKSIYNLPLTRMAEVEAIQSGWNVSVNPIDIVIIGAGGTGGYLIRDLCRFIYSLEKRIVVGEPKISVTIYDGDIVEEKNVLRQNFLPSDIGQNKAEVMTNRHVRAFGTNVSYVPEMFTYYKGRDAKNKTIFVGCVDNNAARREISWVMQDLNGKSNGNDFYWIDSGNEKKTGQVIVGGKKLNTVTDLFPEILNEKEDSQEQISCAERMLQDEQNMFVNLTASNLILNYIKSIILDIPMVTHGTVFNIDNKFDNYYIMKN
jgi:PRTRC genetic system ThiF family protein